MSRSGIAMRLADATLSLVPTQRQKTPLVGDRQWLVGLQMSGRGTYPARGVHDHDFRGTVEPIVHDLKIVEEIRWKLECCRIVAYHARRDHVEDDFVAGEQVSGLLAKESDNLEAIAFSGFQNRCPIFPGGGGKEKYGKKQSNHGEPPERAHRTARIFFQQAHPQSPVSQRAVFYRFGRCGGYNYDNVIDLFMNVCNGNAGPFCFSR
jgi:hypothetical protein